MDTGPQGIYFTAGSQLFRRTESGYSVAATAGGTITGFAVNLQGHAVMVSNRQLYVFDGAATSLVADGSAAAPSGGVFTSWSQVVMDGRDRILALANTSNGVSGLFLYDGAWRTLLVVGESRLQSIRINQVSSIRGTQDRFFALMQHDFGGLVASFRDGDWKPEVSYGDPIPESTQTVGGIGAFDVNQRGEVLVRVFDGRDEVLVRSPSGLKLVLNGSQSIEGSYFGDRNRIDSMILEDDGTVYLAGLDQFGRYIIVRAEPL